MAETLFLKVERLRRLRTATLLSDIVVRRGGEDGTFGIGLSDDNEVNIFYHSCCCMSTAQPPPRPGHNH